jgi:hypothetical protein
MHATFSKLRGRKRPVAPNRQILVLDLTRRMSPIVGYYEFGSAPGAGAHSRGSVLMPDTKAQSRSHGGTPRNASLRKFTISRTLAERCLRLA